MHKFALSSRWSRSCLNCASLNCFWRIREREKAKMVMRKEEAAATGEEEANLSRLSVLPTLGILMVRLCTLEY